MEHNYQSDFYYTERDQQERQQQSQQHQQQHQQHVAPYPVGQPYHATSQHQSEFVVSQPLNVTMFPASFPARSQILHDSDPVLLVSNTVHQAIQRSSVNVTGGQGDKSSTLLSNYATPITTQEPVVASNNRPSATREIIIVRRNSPSVATSESSGKGIAQQTQGQAAIARTSSKAVQNNEHEEQSRASSHQPCTNPPNSSTNSRTVISIHQEIPQSLSYKMASQDEVEGVVAKETIEEGVEFGPYTGTLMNEEQGWSKDTTWEICISDRVHFYIDGHKNWMSHVRCAQREEEQNMEAYQYYGKIYFRTTKVIEPGRELRVFYSDEYKRHVGIETTLQDLKFNQDEQKFQCSLCRGLFPSTKVILRHFTRCKHTIDKADDVLPVPTKNETKKKSVGKVSLKQPLKKEKKARKQDQSVFKCGTCDKVFKSRGRLKAHEMFHEYDQDHTCPVCGKRQRNAQTWAKHMMLHKPVHEPRPHKCNECNGRYKTKLALRKHVNHVHGYPCPICKERFLRKKDCLKHELTHRSLIMSHDGANNLQSATTALSTTASSVAEPAPDEPKDMLGKPATYYLKERPFKCRFCPNTYVDRKGASYHEREVHFGDLPFQCSHCPKSFGRESQLLKHMKKHEENRMYRCTHCPRTFRSESAFKNHQGEHTGLKPFKCELCGRGFRVKKAVCQHKRHVHRNRPMRFFCSVCNKGFTDKGNLVKHERRHTGIRPFICTECGKGFTAKCSLNNHIQRFHTAEKPFSCEICGQKFSLNEQYNHHMIRHKLQGDENFGNGLQQ